jgi:signal transduction histidine kinase
MINHAIRIFLFILLAKFSHAIASDSVDVAKINQSSISLTSHLGIFEDTSQVLQIEDVQKEGVQFQEHSPSSTSINLSYSKSAYWLRINLKNSSEKPIEKIIEISYPLLASIDFYWLSENEYHESIHTGYSQPFENRAHKSRGFVFPLPLQAHSQTVIYIRIASPNAIVIPMQLWEPVAFYQHERDYYSFQSTYFGVVFAIALFCLVLALVLRELDYFLYVAMTLLVAMTLVAYQGLGAELIWQHTPWLTQAGALLFGSLMLAIELMFIRRMLHIPITLPRLDPIFKLLIGSNLLIPLLLVWNFAIAKFVVIFFAISSIFVLIVIALGVINKQRNAYFLCAGFSILAISIILSLLHVLAIIPTSFYVVNSIQIGSALELLIFTLMLTDRYKIIQQDKILSIEQLHRVRVGLDNLTKGIVMADNDRKIIYVNPAAFELFSSIEDEIRKLIPTFSPHQLIGKHIEFFHSNPAYSLEIINGLTKSFMFEMRLGDQIIGVNVTPIFNTQQQRTGSVAEFENITERENNKTRLMQTLEQKQALNQQVNQMQKVESLSRLTSGIAHDFNNILMAISGYNHLNTFAGEDCTDEKLKEEILFNTQQVNMASERAVNLIKKMMTYSRQNPTNKEIETRPSKEVIDEVLAMLRPALTSKFQLHAVVDSELTITIDATELHQILTNLIVNARDAMINGGTITITFKQITTHELVCTSCAQELEGELIELSILDNGTGIEKDVLDRIFDPFFTTKPVGEGTGLGLSTVSGMVHEAQGHIIVESKTTEPSGTVFRLLFPKDYSYGKDINN